MKPGLILVHGIGLNDADYVTQKTVSGIIESCPIYNRWKLMLKRCYSESSLKENKSYIGCSVASEWIKFSGFRLWMVKQDWQGKHLDKDLLVQGNQIYSPETCVFIDPLVNGFLISQAGIRGQYPIGVRIHKASGLLISECRNPFTKKRDFLGYFRCPQKAHLAWKKRKNELACQLADMQTDERVAQALRARYL